DHQWMNLGISIVFKTLISRTLIASLSACIAIPVVAKRVGEDPIYVCIYRTAGTPVPSLKVTTSTSVKVQYDYETGEPFYGSEVAVADSNSQLGYKDITDESTVPPNEDSTPLAGSTYINEETNPGFSSHWLEPSYYTCVYAGAFDGKEHFFSPFKIDLEMFESGNKSPTFVKSAEINISTTGADNSATLSNVSGEGLLQIGYRSSGTQANVNTQHASTSFPFFGYVAPLTTNQMKDLSTTSTGDNVPDANSGISGKPGAAIYVVYTPYGVDELKEQD
ncbi:hypothetical protein, partial [Piscirickettsia litoralis]|uniref:hypothetical protein n=1 Tax=Piscirickettsia litoralis TaxID=1891921 RepID=UPI001F36AC26